MNNIIGNSLGTCDDGSIKNFVYYINKVFNKIGIKRLKNDILLKNHKIVELLSTVELDVTNDIRSDLSRLGLTYIGYFSSEDDDLYDFLKMNKTDLKLGKILFGFVYDDLKISYIVFVSQYADTKYIDNILDNIKKDINKTLSDIDINI